MNTKYRFTFSATAIRQFENLGQDIKKRIQEKLTFWEDQENPLWFAKTTPQLHFASHRFRIGKYRVLCLAESHDLVIVYIGPRENVYKAKN